ncbi:calcium-gated potassium channel MthK [Halalkalicoccus paucihalophilus]|uniref:Calcium-gated potassium channel MthK n=1 Tax=Halalkalicoccus paucihalophilus TaxID=1008153 RepID=A0A151AA89_9EURY|nr:NAD-binding protein [Halalkalicoccus paucihalophilus]KYH24523.1 calcium-gated potassium channel MthK [Halalkalicoccus paucihalophilus]
MLDYLHAYKPGKSVAIESVVAIAFVSIATGVIAIITEPVVGVSGFLGTIGSIAGFSGTVLGFALLVTAWGMQRGYRFAYLVAGVLIFLAAVHGIVQLRLLSIPLAVLSVGGLIVLTLTSDRFTRQISISDTQLGALAAIVGVVCYGTAGTYALRAGFDDVETVLDALYFTLITATTVGYGDIHPLTEEARLFVTSLVVLGPATIAATAGSVFSPILRAQLSKGVHNESSQATARSNHVVVLGYGDLAAPIVNEFSERTSFTIITENTAAVEQSDIDAEVITGDPTNGRLLERAGIEDATAVVVVTGPEDTPNIIRAVRDRVESVHLVAVSHEADVETLEGLGVDVVIDPQMILGAATVDAALGGHDS